MNAPQFGADGETSAMQFLQTLCDASQQQQEGHMTSSLLISCTMVRLSLSLSLHKQLSTISDNAK